MQSIFGLLAVQLGLTEIDQDQVDVGAAGDDVDTGGARIVLQQPLGQDRCAVERALLALAEFRCRSEFERDGLGGDDVLERAALLAGEHRRVELLGQHFVVGQDDAAAWAAQCLVGGRRDDVGVRHRRGCRPAATSPAKWAMSTMR